MKSSSVSITSPSNSALCSQTPSPDTFPVCLLFLPVLPFNPHLPSKKVLTLHKAGGPWRVASTVWLQKLHKVAELTDWRNRSSIFSLLYPPPPPPQITFSVCPVLISLAPTAFISFLSARCLVSHFEMLNLRSFFELIIKSEGAEETNLQRDVCGGNQ